MFAVHTKRCKGWGSILGQRVYQIQLQCDFRIVTKFNVVCVVRIVGLGEALYIGLHG